jgi:hypothetical protein
MMQLTSPPVVRRVTSSALLAAVVALSACEGSTGPNANATLRIASPAQAGLSSETATGLSITGSNGTLLLTALKVIVDEFELENDDDDCDDDQPGGTCGEFEAELFIADVPLGSGAVTVANDRIPSGTYTKLEFAIEDLDDDADDDDGPRIAALLAQLRTTYADWPAGASMMIEGTFTPTGGAPQAFRVYFEAEVEIEKTFATPLVIDGNSMGLTIELRPDLWFRNGDGTVRDLSQWNWATTSSLIEFEVEFEQGTRVKIDFDD